MAAKEEILAKYNVKASNTSVKTNSTASTTTSNTSSAKRTKADILKKYNVKASNTDASTVKSYAGNNYITTKNDKNGNFVIRDTSNGNTYSKNSNTGSYEVSSKGKNTQKVAKYSNGVRVFNPELSENDPSGLENTAFGKALKSGAQDVKGMLQGVKAMATSQNSALSLADQSKNMQNGMSYTQARSTAQQKWADNLSKAQETLENSSSLLNEAKDGKTSIEKIALDAVSQLPGMAFDSLFTPVGGSLASMAVRSAGGYYADVADSADDNKTLGYKAIYASLSGVKEAATELLSSGLSKIYGKAGADITDTIVEKIMQKASKNPELIGKLARFGLDTAGEGIEEILSDVIDPINRTIYSGNDILAEYSTEDLSQWAYDGLIGAVLGGVGGTVNFATNTMEDINTYNQAKKTYGNNVQDLVNESNELSPGNKLANNVQNRLNNNKNVSGKLINRLVNQNEADIYNNDKSTIAKAAENQLKAYGETGNVTEIAQALAKQAAGETLTKSEENTISNSKYGQRVANELNADNISSGNYNTSWAQNLNTERINADQYSSMLANDSIQTANVPQQATASTQASVNVASNETTPVKAETTTESVTEPQNVQAETEQNVETQNTNTTEVTTSETESDSVTSLEDASKKYGAQAQAYISTYNKGQDITQYDKAYKRAYEYGASSVPFDTVKGLESVSYLTDAQKEIAYDTGKEASANKASSKATDISSQANGKTGKPKGTIKLEGKTAKGLNSQQKKATRVLRTVAEATGINIVLYSSETDENGNYVGANGRFEHNNPNTIYIDLNSGLLNSYDDSDIGKYAMLRTFSHEFVHFVEHWNPIQYNELRKAVFDQITENGENVDDLIQDRMRKSNLEYEAASREVVAESLTDILPQSSFVQNLAENHKTIFNQLVEKLKAFVNNVKAYYQEIGANRSPEAKALKQQIGDAIQYTENIVKLFDNVAEQAVTSYQQAFAIDEETNEVTMSEEPIKAEEETGTEVEPEARTSTSDFGFTVRDNTERNGVEVTFDNGKPSQAVIDTLKSLKMRWHSKYKYWYGKVNHDDLFNALEYTYNKENGTVEKELANAKAEEPVVKEIDVNALFNGLSNAQGKANTTGETQSVKLSDYAKSNEEETPTPAELTNMFESAVKKDLTPEQIKAAAEIFGIEAEKTKPASEETVNNKLFGNNKEEETTNDQNEDNERAVQQLDENGEGTSQLLATVETEPVQRTSGGQRTVSDTSEAGRGTGGNSESEPEQSGRSRGTGAGESGVSELNGLTPEQEEKKAEQLKEVVNTEIEQKSTVTPKGNNFVINESLDLPKGEKARFHANVEAIKLIKQLDTEGRYATPEEQTVLSKYVGWGGLANAFGEYRYDRETRHSGIFAKQGWEAEFAELKQLVEEGTITEQEYKDMSASTRNAHYTSVEVINAMYDGLTHLGFTGGRMLEPSCGVGNFAGGVPVSMVNSINSFTMIELDRITSQIAKYLYPNYDVRNQGFEQANIPNNFIDVAIGNVPFGKYGVVDRSYPKYLTKSIHNYFFAKSIDKVRPGGLVMYITSHFTMDAKESNIREYLMSKADLIGAIRLPETAFKSNAETSVVTDIIILKKRADGTEYAGEAFANTVENQFPEDYWNKYNLNEYFVNHPEMVLGEPAKVRGMYGAESYTVKPFEDKGTLGDQIRTAINSITTTMDYKYMPTPEKANYAVEKANKKPKEGGYVVKDGKLMQNKGGKLSEATGEQDKLDRIEGLVKIRDAYNELLNCQLQGLDKKVINKARKDLNVAYDDFVKKYGLINYGLKNKAALQEMPEEYALRSLENYDSKNRKNTTKADIFTKDTITPNKTVTSANSVEEGIIVSINRKGGVDAKYIAELTGKTEEEATREIIENRLAFKTQNGLVAPETYLSGNVRAKLKEAQALAPYDEDYKINVEELERVIPKDIEFQDINVSIGAQWVPKEVYADFIAHMLGGYNDSEYREPDVSIDKTLMGEYKIVINNKRLKKSSYNTQRWGTSRRSFLDIIDRILNSGSLTVNDTIETPDGKKKSVLNKQETVAVQAKADEIAKEFKTWLWQDETRKNELTRLYNDTFNALVNPKYSGKNLTVNGLNPAMNLREHQANAVQRIISSGGNTLLAHRVGAGKTLEMAAAAMKLRELGIVKKPMFVVPKSLVAQWGNEFKNYFPAAKLLVSDDDSFTPTNRKTNANRIANGDYDAIILSYEQFEKIPMSKEYMDKYYQEQIDEILRAIAEEKAENGKSLSIKQMQTTIERLKKKQADLSTKAKDEDNILFENLGVDSLFVDEAHNFKNLFYNTKMHNVSGLGSTDGAQRSTDLYTKVRYLQQMNGGRGIVFATATPVMNSMAEMYIMQKYLQSDALNQLGLRSFDAWAKQFGEIVNGIEIKPSGQGFRVKQSFSNFINLNELQLQFRSFSDVLTEVPGLKIPKMRGGKVNIVECELGEYQKQYMKDLEKRADNIKNVDPSVDNMLKITSDGRKVSYSQKLIDSSLPYEPGSKIFKCCDNIYKEYVDSTNKTVTDLDGKKIKLLGTQIVFCDMGTPNRNKKSTSKSESTEDTDDVEETQESINIYKDMKEYLVNKGIPANEIAFIHDAKNDAQKAKLFDDVNSGKVRVLIGSTGKMGVGMNAQKRVVAIHHLDAPWRPGDVEQRDGRAFRQKNLNEEVAKYVYVSTGSFDARLWDILDRKQHFINQIMNGEDIGRSAEDTGDVTLSAAEVKALASGNPLVKEIVEVDAELDKVSDLKRSYDASIVLAKNKLLKDEQSISQFTKAIENVKLDIKARKDTYKDDTFSMTIGNKKFTDKREAGLQLASDIKSKVTDATLVEIGNFAGFDLKVMKADKEYIGYLVGKQNYKFNVYPDNTTYMINHIMGVVENFESKQQSWEKQLTEAKADKVSQEKLIQEPFKQAGRFEELQSRHNEIMAILNPPTEQVLGDEDTQEQARDYEDTQYQDRTSPMTDREVLSVAASIVENENLSDGERDALRIFQNRLGKLEELQSKRAEEGKLYKEQQFGQNVDRAAAKETLARMKTLDAQIDEASKSVLDTERKEVLRSVLKKSRKVVETAEKEQNIEALRRYKARQREAASIRKYKARIKTDVDTLKKWIEHPDNKSIYHHVPDVIKENVISFLLDIDFTSKRQLRGGEATKADIKFEQGLDKLRDTLKSIDVGEMYGGYVDLPPNFMDDLEKLRSITRALVNLREGGFVINNMSADELKLLSKIVKVLKKTVTQMNSFHNNAMFKHTFDAGDDSIAYMNSINTKERMSKVGATVSDFVLWQQIRPAYAFERFGKGGISIYDELRQGQARLAFNAIQIKNFAEETYTTEEVKEWEKQENTVDLGGVKVTMPVSYIMGFYELSKRPQALGHILGAGIRVATHETKNGKRTEIVNDVGHALTPADVSKLIDTLTDRQKEVADKLQQYMAKQGGEWGNYVSVARFGEEQFGEEHYYPINSDGRHLEANADEKPGNASLYALLNMSFTKELTEKANNRIVLYSIFDVFANHMASMAQYNAFALPVLDCLKWFNYKQTVDTEEGKMALNSVREEMARVYGTPVEAKPGRGSNSYAESFVIGIVKAFNGTETQGIPQDTMGINALHKYNMAAVAYNFRVVVQQPMAITRAGMILDVGNIAKGFTLKPSEIQQNIEEMNKYSGIAAWKSLGFYDVNISRGLTDVIKHSETPMDKIGDVGMWGAEKADELTWSAIWSACKQQVKRGNMTEEEYFKKVSELFEDVIYKTQVVDSVLTKNEYLRSKGALARMIGSFMSEPTTTASMLVNAYDKYATDLQRGMNRQQAWKNNSKFILRTTAVYCVGQTMLAAVQAVLDAWRDDDDYETFLQKWLEQFKGNLIDELMPFNKLPILSQVYDLSKRLLSAMGVDTYGNPPRSVILQWGEDAVEGVEIMSDIISGKDTNYQVYGGVYKLLGAISGLTGLPLASATREVISAWNNVVGSMAPSLKVKTYEASASTEIKYAYQDGYLSDEEAMQKLIEAGEADDENEAYWYVERWKSGEGSNSTYFKVYEAMESGEGFTEAVNEMTSHGYTEKQVISQVKSRIGKLYKEGKITRQQASQMLSKYAKLSSSEISDKLASWDK